MQKKSFCLICCICVNIHKYRPHSSNFIINASMNPEIVQVEKIPHVIMLSEKKYHM